MVTTLKSCFRLVSGTVLAQVASPPPKAIDPVLRAKLIGQLFLLIVGGLAFLAVAWLALRAGRRYVQRSDNVEPWSNSGKELALDDWAKRPIVPKIDDVDESDAEGQ